jgi:SAM-dependent methyltransferase
MGRRRAADRRRGSRLRRLGLLLLAGLVIAQSSSGDSSFTPYIGLPGKDVIWLPADLVMVDRMLKIAKVTREDLVVDLGSGDGRTVIEAAKRGAQAVGVELNASLVALSRRYALQEGVGDRAVFVQQDLFDFDLSRASVITLFLMDTLNVKLRPKLLALRPGTRIVSNTFNMGEWRPDETVRDEARPECDFNCIAYLWIVPAQVEGTWILPAGVLTLRQTFQTVSGTLDASANREAVSGRLRGDELRFSIGATHYVGRVTGGTIEGTSFAGGEQRAWRATRRP